MMKTSKGRADARDIANEEIPNLQMHSACHHIDLLRSVDCRSKTQHRTYCSR